MKRLIVNADDFGYARGVTDGIVEAHQRGIVTSTTVMANMPDAERACRMALDLPNLSVGIHFTLTQFVPVLPARDVPSLVDASGHFLSSECVMRRAMRFEMNFEEIVAELSAQVERVLAWGLRPTHFDSHHHICMYPQTFLAACEVARRFGIRRMRCGRAPFRVRRDVEVSVSDRVKVLRCNAALAPKSGYYTLVKWWARLRYGIVSPDGLLAAIRLVPRPAGDTFERWAATLASAPDGTFECISHPGYEHDFPEDKPQMRAQRLEELKVLTDPRLREIVERRDIQLIGYHEL